MGEPTLSVCIPTYNRSIFVREAITSVLKQDFSDFELLIVDDCSSDNTASVVSSFIDPRIRYVRNETNLGAVGVLPRCAELISSDIMYFLCDDDILLDGALGNAIEAFRDDDVGAVTRPYYWFIENPTVPIRAIFPPDAHQNKTFSIQDGKEAIHAIFRSVGQLSGLAFRKRDFLAGFGSDIFTPHVAAFADVLRRRKIVYLNNFAVAVRTTTSISRSASNIYAKSPTQQWIDMFKDVFADPEFAAVRSEGIDFVCGTNYEGLVQIATTASRRLVAREISILARQRPRNIANPKFWAYGLGTIVMPPRLLRFLADEYKSNLLSLRVRSGVMKSILTQRDSNTDDATSRAKEIT